MLLSKLEKEGEHVFAVRRPAEGLTPIVAEPIEKSRADIIKGRHVAIVYEKGRSYAKGVSISVVRVANGGAANVRQYGGALRIEGGLSVLSTFLGRFDLAEAARGTIRHVTHSPSMRI